MMTRTYTPVLALTHDTCIMIMSLESDSELASMISMQLIMSLQR